MVSKTYSIIVYASWICTIVYYSFQIRLDILYGLGNVPGLFQDPKDLGVNLYLALATVSWLFNAIFILPSGFIITIYAVWNKRVHRDTVLLFLFNFIFFYLDFKYMNLGIHDWIFD